MSWYPYEKKHYSNYLLIFLCIVLFSSLVVFGPVLALHQTVFNSDYFASQVDEIDIPLLTEQWLSDNLAQDKPHQANIIKIGVINLEPWIKEQLKSAVRCLHTSILNRIAKGELLNMIVEQRPLVDDVVNNIEEVSQLPLLEPVLGSFGITPDLIQEYIGRDKIDTYFDFLEQLARNRQIIISSQKSFVPLILFILVLIACIILMRRNVKSATRIFGIIFTLGGIAHLSGITTVTNYGGSLSTRYTGIPLLQNIVQRLTEDFTCILEIFGIALLILGVLLIIFSFVYKFRPQKS